ncbi:Serine/threonine-protein kinase TNNI3K [Leucoagaricus sp. SymC.cos]|nr:Serine/threonine-protein kinase TNNI3K [Leucoagaricus sp. SymC.cos]
MMRLCTMSGAFPRLLILQDVEFLGDQPVTTGGFGEIWKGRYRNITVCLKVARVTQKSDYTGLLKDLTREGIVWSQLSHPNLLPFYGIFPSGDSYGRISLVSPWQENGNISEYLRSNPEEPRLPLVFDVLEGLQYLHEQQIVHEDLKSANILITSAGSACLADFGLSSVVETSVLRWTSLPTMARTGGTLRWQAPELMEELEDGSLPQPTFSSDIYSLASVMYEIFTGKIPYHEWPREATVMFKILQGLTPTRPPEDAETEMADQTWNLMECSWSLNIEDRPNIVEVIQRMHRIPQTNLTLQRRKAYKGNRRKPEDAAPQTVRLKDGRPTFNAEEMGFMLRLDAVNSRPESRVPEGKELQGYEPSALDTTNLPDEHCYPPAPLPKSHNLKSPVPGKARQTSGLKVASQFHRDDSKDVESTSASSTTVPLNLTEDLYRLRLTTGRHLNQGDRQSDSIFNNDATSLDKFSDTDPEDHEDANNLHRPPPPLPPKANAMITTADQSVNPPALQDWGNLPAWKRIYSRLLNWAVIWHLKQFDEAIESTAPGKQVNEDALSIWTTQTYKRYVRALLTDSPARRVERLFVPPDTADAINTAIFAGRHKEASDMLKDLWTPLGLDGMPRLILALAKHKSDSDHWVVHRFSLPDSGLSTYDTYPERTASDARVSIPRISTIRDSHVNLISLLAGGSPFG